MEPLGPGTYHVRRNASGKPSLYTSGGTPIQDPSFETIGAATLIFKIEDDNKNGYVFSATPLTWEAETPAGNRVVRDPNNVLLTLSVTSPPPEAPAKTYHFLLRFNSGEIPDVLWSHDGGTVLDPTIIEKPPEG